jgi:hypothetical protein
LIVVLITLPVLEARATVADPFPVPTGTDEPTADYPQVSLSMKDSGTGNPVGGTTGGIGIYFCPIFVRIPLVKSLSVPQSGLSDCVQLQGFPRFCPWPYFYRVKVTIIKQPKCGGTVTATMSGLTSDTIQACFNISMQGSTCDDDSFGYEIKYPRSAWGGWMFWWPQTYYRIGVIKISKQGSY